MSDEYQGHMPTPTPDNPQLVDSSLLQEAVGFAAAAAKFPDWFVLYFLIGRSLELALKAYAIRHGASEKELRALGHSLRKTLDFVVTRGFVTDPPLSTGEIAAVHLLSESYEHKFLEYPEVQGYVVPKSGPMRQVCDKVIAAAYTSIWGAQRYALDRQREKIGVSVDPDAHYDFT